MSSPAQTAGVFKDARKAAFLNREGADKPLKSPIPHAVLMRARANRKRRMVEQCVAHDCMGILLYDPVNIRYALDVCNMQVWMTHNPSHYAVICADGHGIDFEYKGSEHVAKGIETIDEIRPAKSWCYFSAGNRLQERVRQLKARVDIVVVQIQSGTDKIHNENK